MVSLLSLNDLSGTITLTPRSPSRRNNRATTTSLWGCRVWFESCAVVSGSGSLASRDALVKWWTRRKIQACAPSAPRADGAHARHGIRSRGPGTASFRMEEAFGIASTSVGTLPYVPGDRGGYAPHKSTTTTTIAPKLRGAIDRVRSDDSAQTLK